EKVTLTKPIDRKEFVENKVEETITNKNKVAQQIVEDDFNQDIKLEQHQNLIESKNKEDASLDFQKINQKVDLENLKVSSATDVQKTVKSQDIEKTNLKEPFLANVFLNNQKVLQKRVSDQALKESKDLLNQKEKGAIEKSAKILDLNPVKIEIEREEEVSNKTTSIKKDEKTKSNKEFESKFFKNRLSSLSMQAKFAQNGVLNKHDIISNDLQDTTSLKTTSAKEPNTQEIVRTSQKIESLPNIMIQVPQEISQTIQTKIIAAKQQLNSFMSDLARNMYLNYKPPMTAFRISLNPANMGTIDVMMKANKVDNTLSISMNVANSGTMDLLNDNKQVLQSALLRNLGDQTNISLGVSLQNGDSSGGEFANNQGQNGSGQNQNRSNSFENLTQGDQNEDQENSIENYM
ncbi:MAG: flagellar hook-length control protein FliK, partial [Campylobacterales bacterium]|nr:flagellar hook-length control protein FliK [Campylobacterales bacterium]